MKLLNLVSVLCLALMLMPDLKAGENSAIWYKLNSTKEERLWLVAFEEIEQLQKELGNWYPIDLIRIEAKRELFWRVTGITRKSGKCKMFYEIRDSKGKTAKGVAQWSDGGKDRVLDALVTHEEGEVFVSVTQDDGSIRRLMFKRASSLGAMAETVKVSRAMPLWKWNPAFVIDF